MVDPYAVVRRLGFRFEPERAHRLALGAYRALGRLRRIDPPGNPVSVMGVAFPNVVGLAAGYDKDAVAWRGLAGAGFGHIEVGTVTPRPQPGNQRPRVFRFPESGALVNRMGFPSDGADAVAARLERRSRSRIVLGVSIGPNRVGDFEEVAADYETLVDRFAPLSDYLAINVSSPNTTGLRELQSGTALEELLGRIVTRRDAAAFCDRPRPGDGEPVGGEAPPRRRTPLVVKLSPDVEPADLEWTVASIEQAGIDGIILTNTTTRRPGDTAGEAGGLSGAPLRASSLQMLQRVRAMTPLPLIASGGIMTLDDARQRLDAGASLVQLYTGFVYSGPALVRAVAGLSSPSG